MPRGKIDILEEYRVKFFLALSGTNKEKIAEPLRKKGWKAFPFFVIDPYDRSSFPSVESGLVDGDPRLAAFERLIFKSVNLINEGKITSLLNKS